MYETLLVPTDGSDVAAVASKAAFVLAERFDTDVHAVHVLQPGSGNVTYGEEVVKVIEDAAKEVGVETTGAVLEIDDPVHRSIIEYATDHDVDCIVMGTHGRSSLGQYVLGSVAERTLRDAPLPVVTVHEETVVPTDVERILIPTDGSESANAAAEHALEFAARTDASVHTVHVVDVGEIEDDEDGAIHDALEESGRRAIEAVIERARERDVNIEASVLSGVPHQAINDYASANSIDYIFMGTHGRTGVSRHLLGSVTERVIRLSDVPVVSLKAAEPDD